MNRFHSLALFCWLIGLLFCAACGQAPYLYIQNTDALKSYITQIAATQPDIVKPKSGGKTPIATCNQAANYAPDAKHPEHTPIRWVRINAHIMNSSDSSRNFKGDEARYFIRRVIETANYKLNENKQMHLPVGNNTPVLPPRFQWLLTGDADKPNHDGVYFHYDDQLFWINKKGPNSFHSRDVCDKYSVYADSIINIFFVEHHPDSCKSKTYKASGDGIGYTNCVKIIGAYNTLQTNLANKMDNAFEVNVGGYADLLNHELGHSVGLPHTWNGQDGCDDTPPNNNCWNYNEGKNCETEVSNNIMDYNAFRNALTPCQIGRVHYNLSQTQQRQHAFAKPTWCQRDPNATIYLQKGDTITWSSIKDLNGDLVIQSGAQLTLKCTLSMPPDSRIIVQSDATLILDACTITQRCPSPKTWRGIELQKSKGKHKANLIVKNNATLQTFN